MLGEQACGPTVSPQHVTATCFMKDVNTLCDQVSFVGLSCKA